MPLTLNRGGDASQAEEVHLRVHSGQDLSQQVFRFCAANNLHSAEQVGTARARATARLRIRVRARVRVRVRVNLTRT